MKNQYFGDVNDYQKYGLLRILSGWGRVTTGVCWMLTPSDGLAHGQSVGYLDQPHRWRGFDPELFDFLRQRVRIEGRRDVRLIEQSNLLPATRFYSDLLADEAGERCRYFRAMLERFLGSDLIFFDPDNGFQVKSTPLGRKGSSKFLYWHELAEAYSAGHSVLAYQHFTRVQRDVFVERLVESLRARTGEDAGIYSFRTSHVVFFLVSRPGDEAHFERRAEEVTSLWRGQIRVSRH